MQVCAWVCDFHGLEWVDGFETWPTFRNFTIYSRMFLKLNTIIIWSHHRKYEVLQVGSSVSNQGYAMLRKRRFYLFKWKLGKGSPNFFRPTIRYFGSFGHRYLQVRLAHYTMHFILRISGYYQVAMDLDETDKFVPWTNLRNTFWLHFLWSQILLFGLP